MIRKQDEGFDIIIIGGGIVGLSLAYYLAAKSDLRLALLEKDLLAQASTGLSVGGIRQQFSHPVNIRLSQHSLHLLDILRYQLGNQESFLIHQVGYLFLVQSDNVWSTFLENVALQQNLQVPVEVLSPAQIKKQWPFLRTDDLAGGTFCSADGYTDPYQVAMVYARGCRQQKVVILEQTPVEKIEVEAQRVQAVITPQGRLSASLVINAAGAWAGEVAALAGIKLPITPLRRQVFVTHPFRLGQQPLPLIIDFENHFYFREEGLGYLLGLSDPAESPGFKSGIELSLLERLTEIATHRVPTLAQASIARGWSGLYAMTPDENPILGPLPEVEGFWVASGFSGHGFQHAPAVGDILSDLILSGETNFDLGPYRYQRFQNSTSSKGEERTV